MCFLCKNGAIDESKKIALNADANPAVLLNTPYKSSAHTAPKNMLQQMFSLMYSNNCKG
jgi:hypothetical protein